MSQDVEVQVFSAAPSIFGIASQLRFLKLHLQRFTQLIFRSMLDVRRD
jgi:hypothetical protein